MTALYIYCMSQYFVSVSDILYKEEYKHGTVQYISIQYVTTREDSLIHSREYKGLLEVGNLLVSSSVSRKVKCSIISKIKCFSGAVITRI